MNIEEEVLEQINKSIKIVGIIAFIVGILTCLPISYLITSNHILLGVICIIISLLACFISAVAFKTETKIGNRFNENEFEVDVIYSLIFVDVNTTLHIKRE